MKLFKYVNICFLLDTRIILICKIVFNISVCDILPNGHFTRKDSDTLIKVQQQIKSTPNCERLFMLLLSTGLKMNMEIN